jgi:DNA-binding response OmpR family regulator/anti-sigma regulatory factor (Ser/Thr protein kinase)
MPTCTHTPQLPSQERPKRELSTILIVDDQPLSRMALVSILSKAGYATLQASDGEEAWELLSRNEISLVVADYAMPRLDGFGLCRRMKSLKKHRLTPVVMVTGIDDIASRIAAFDHGADDILPKPVINEELLARVKNLIKFSKLVQDQVETERCRAEMERELALAKMREEQEQTRNRLYREVLFAATGGTLKLLDGAGMERLLQGWTHTGTLALSDTSQIGQTRKMAEALARLAEMDEEAVGDVVLCVSEAVTNALKFGSRAEFRCGLKDDQIQVYVQDDGPGLDQATLPQITLQKGFSSHSSMGMGFSLMLETMDRVGLCTGPSGTAVLLSRKCAVDEEQCLDRFLERFSVSL